MKLTNIQIKNAKPQAKMYRLSDGQNLYLEITPAGSKLWRLAYRFNGKRRQIALGNYPVISLQEAREKRMETQKLLVAGHDPVETRRQDKLESEMHYANNFEAIAREWHEQKRHTWQPKHAGVILKRLEHYIFPVIGKKPINEIKPPELLHAIRPIEQEDKYEMAHRMLQTSGQIFRYGVATGKASRDITQDLRGALKPVTSTNFAHLTEQELPAFLHKLNRYDTAYNGNPITKWAFQLLILTFVRSGELRGARWEEIDMEKCEWRIPAERMKMKEQHIVPLCPQAIELFSKIKEVTGNSYSGYVLPSFANPRKTISENTFLKVIDKMGYKGKATGHGFRATASTILNEHGFKADVIERQLAHCERNQVRAAYNHAEYLSERKEMMRWWGEYLMRIGML